MEFKLSIENKNKLSKLNNGQNNPFVLPDVGPDSSFVQS